MNEKKYFVDFDGDNPEALLAIMSSIVNGGFLGRQRELTPEELEAQRQRRYNIGQGILMVPTDDFSKIKDMGNLKDICYLYKDGVKLTEIPFRQGGLFSGFKDNREYCNIIAYPELLKGKYAFGNHVIINTKGEIVLQSKDYDHPYYHKGVIASIKQTYYNLLTKEPIVYGSKSVGTDTFLFVENSYNFGGGEKYEKGVYKIEYATGNFEIFK